MPSAARRRWPARLLAVIFGSTVATLAGVALLAGLGWRPVNAQEAPSPTREQLLQAAFDEVRDRVAPLPPQRAFSRRALRVAASTSPHAELLALRDELAALEASLERGALWGAWRASEDISERLALFPWRFAADPQDVEGWDELSLAAQALLGRIERCELELNEKDSYAQLLRSLLLELSDRTAEAAVALAAVTVGMGCGNCAAERMGVVNRRRSEAAERRGELDEAAERLGGTLVDMFGFGGPVDRVDPVTCTRAALLFAQTGSDADAVLLFQLVADLRPGTPSAEVSRAALEQMGAWIEPTAERIEVHLEAAEAESFEGRRRMQRRLALQALAGVAGAAAFDRVAAAYDEDEKDALAALAALRDERARPRLEAALRTGEADGFEPALQGLHDLPGGARRHVEPMLQRLAEPDRDFVYFDDAALDGLLREICGGGPELRGFDRMKDHEWARAWLEWLRRTPAPPSPGPARDAR